MNTPTGKTAQTLAWETSVPLLTTPIVLRQTTGVFALTFLLISGFLCVLFALEGKWSGILPSVSVVALIHLGLIAGVLLVMAVYFGNRIAMGFRLDRRGVCSEVREARAHRAAKLAVILGLASGNFSAAGAGMLARSGATSFVPWARVERVRFDDGRCTVYLCNGWRTLAALFCSEENYPAVKAFVMAKRRK